MPRPSDVAVGTAIILLNDQNQVLLGKRRGAHAAGCWSLPGGWLDRSDSATADAVVREAWEETGITAHSCQKLTWTTEDHPELGCRTVTLYHIARSYQWSGVPELREPHKNEGWHWFDLDKLPEPLFPGLAGILRIQHLEDTGCI